MGVNMKSVRINTGLVNIYATKLLRYQLIYVCVAQIVREVVNSGVELPDCLKHFTDDGDFNFATYHNRTDSEETKMERLLKDAAVAMSLCKGSIQETSEHQILDQCYSVSGPKCFVPHDAGAGDP